MRRAHPRGGVIGLVGVVAMCCLESVRVSSIPRRHARELARGEYVVPQRKGARAFLNAEKGIGTSSLEGDHTLRILVHKVNDTTNALYL